MKIAPTPWTAAHDGHGGICLDDAQGRQIGFVSARPEQDAHAALLSAAPLLLAALQKARAEMAGLPHSLGYEFTHLPQIDAALASAGVGAA